MRPLSTAALVALAAALPGAARGASAPAGLVHEKTVYTDSADVALRAPEGVACDDKGAVVIADTGNARLLTFTWRDGVVDGGEQVKLAQLPYPVRVQIDPKGFVLALDRRTRQIVRVDASGGYAGVVAVKGAEAPLSPAAFRVDGAGTVWVLDVVARRVIAVDTEGKAARELPVPKEATGAVDLAVDAGGNVYLLDAVAAVVWMAAPTASAFGTLSRPLKDVASFPAYLAPDNRGKLFVVDQHGNGVLRLGVDGGFQGRELATGFADGALGYPGQVCVTGAGEVIVADRANHRVQIFGPHRRP